MAENLLPALFCTAIQAFLSAGRTEVGSVAVSPRGDLRMPSDACAAVWLQQLEEIG
mgnify:CR=1 FL=1